MKHTVVVVALVANLGADASAKAKDASFDFALVLNACKMMVASNKTESKVDNIKVAVGDPMNVICSRHPGQKVKCTYADRKGKVIAADIELNVIFELEGYLDLATENRSSRISINTSGGVVTIENIAMGDRPDLSGSKICSGTYLTKTAFDALLREDKRKPSSKEPET